MKRAVLLASVLLGLVALPTVAQGEELVHEEAKIKITLPDKDWAVDGSRGGSGRSRNVNPLGFHKGTQDIDPEGLWTRLAEKHERIAHEEARAEIEFSDDAETLVVAFGSAARFVRYVVEQMRAEGHRIGYARPITLWPFPEAEVAAAARTAKRVLVFEQNAGQMIDDVRLSILGHAPVISIGGISTDPSGFGVGSLLNTDRVRERIDRGLGQMEASR